MLNITDLWWIALVIIDISIIAIGLHIVIWKGFVEATDG